MENFTFSMNSVGYKTVTAILQDRPEFFASRSDADES